MKRIFLLAALGLSIVGSLHAQSIDELTGRAPVDDPVVWESRKAGTLRREVYEAYDRMRRAARRDGVRLKIVSAWRGFDRQKWIWERKWNAPERAELNDSLRALDILRYSSMPGTSRHHWGTDVDLNSVEDEFFERRRGRKIYAWLSANAEQYGFFQPYGDGRTRGYAVEKWHWSYAPLSRPYLKRYLDSVECSDLSGFEGCETACLLDIIGGWVEIE